MSAKHDPADKTIDEPSSTDSAVWRISAARRRGLIALLGRNADFEKVRTYLDDPDGTVRAGALATLARSNQATAKDADLALQDRDPNVRRRACELALALKDAPYVDLLDDSDHLVVEAACFALGELRDQSGVERLCEIARSHPDPLCRESAVAALGAIGDECSLATIIASLQDVAAIRRRAAVALAAFDPELAKESLETCRNDRDWQVRQIAEDLLDRP